MDYNLIIDDGEFSIARNNLDRYIVHLVEGIERYLEIVEEVQLSDLEDQAIRAALEDLKVRIGAQRLLLAELADPIKAAVNSCVSQVEGVDCFDYPEQSFGDIKALLASFL